MSELEEGDVDREAVTDRAMIYDLLRNALIDASADGSLETDTERATYVDVAFGVLDEMIHGTLPYKGWTLLQKNMLTHGWLFKGGDPYSDLFSNEEKEILALGAMSPQAWRPRTLKYLLQWNPGRDPQSEEKVRELVSNMTKNLAQARAGESKKYGGFYDSSNDDLNPEYRNITLPEFLSTWASQIRLDNRAELDPLWETPEKVKDQPFRKSEPRDPFGFLETLKEFKLVNANDRRQLLQVCHIGPEEASLWAKLCYLSFSQVSLSTLVRYRDQVLVKASRSQVFDAVAFERSTKRFEQGLSEMLNGKELPFLVGQAWLNALTEKLEKEGVTHPLAVKELYEGFMVFGSNPLTDYRSVCEAFRKAYLWSCTSSDTSTRFGSAVNWLTRRKVNRCLSSLRFMDSISRFLPAECYFVQQEMVSFVGKIGLDGLYKTFLDKALKLVNKDTPLSLVDFRIKGTQFYETDGPESELTLDTDESVLRLVPWQSLEWTRESDKIKPMILSAKSQIRMTLKEPDKGVQTGRTQTFTQDLSQALKMNMGFVLTVASMSNNYELPAGDIYDNPKVRSRDYDLAATVLLCLIVNNAKGLKLASVPEYEGRDEDDPDRQVREEDIRSPVRSIELRPDVRAAFEQFFKSGTPHDLWSENNKDQGPMIVIDPCRGRLARSGRSYLDLLFGLLTDRTLKPEGKCCNFAFREPILLAEDMPERTWFDTLGNLAFYLFVFGFAVGVSYLAYVAACRPKVDKIQELREDAKLTANIDAMLNLDQGRNPVILCPSQTNQYALASGSYVHRVDTSLEGEFLTSGYEAILGACTLKHGETAQRNQANQHLISQNDLLLYLKQVDTERNESWTGWWKHLDKTKITPKFGLEAVRVILNTDPKKFLRSTFEVEPHFIPGTVIPKAVLDQRIANEWEWEVKRTPLDTAVDVAKYLGSRAASTAEEVVVKIIIYARDDPKLAISSLLVTMGLARAYRKSELVRVTVNTTASIVKFVGQVGLTVLLPVISEFIGGLAGQVAGYGGLAILAGSNIYSYRKEVSTVWNNTIGASKLYEAGAPIDPDDLKNQIKKAKLEQ